MVFHSALVWLSCAMALTNQDKNQNSLTLKSWLCSHFNMLPEMNWAVSVSVLDPVFCLPGDAKLSASFYQYQQNGSAWQNADSNSNETFYKYRKHFNVYYTNRININLIEATLTFWQYKQENTKKCAEMDVLKEQHKLSRRLAVSCELLVRSMPTRILS